MVFIENDVSSSMESEKKCVFFCNQAQILGVGIGAGVLLIALILAVTGCFFMKKQKPSKTEEKTKEKENEEAFAVSGAEII